MYIGPGNIEYGFLLNRTPFAPPGAKVIVHDMPSNKATWKPHGKYGWCLDSATDHYRCHKTYIKEIAADRVVRTVKFLPHNYSILNLSPEHNISQDATDLVKALNSEHPESRFHVITK